jgi:hypothetical protein
MASPFRTFRKNQKVWMAAITIMAVIAFVFMSNPMQSLSRMGGRQPAVVQTKFGSLTQPEVAILRSQRHALIEFLVALGQHFALDPKGSQQATGNIRQILNVLGPDTEEAAIDRWVYARTAESMGAIVDDKTVGNIMSVLLVGEPDPQAFLENALRNAGRGMNQAVFLHAMREQLLALRLMQFGHQYDNWAGISSSPGERWDYFKRLRQQASIEVAMLLPKDFVKDVKDPADKDLEEFFNQHKNVEPTPDSADPGFRSPRKVNVEYLEADAKRFLDQITDADISQEYDSDPKIYARNKEEFENEEKQERDAREKEDKEEAAAKAGAEKKNGTDSTKSAAKPDAKPDIKPAAKPVAKSQAEPQAGPATNPAPKSGPAPGAVKSPEPPKPAGTGTKPAGSSSNQPRTPFRLVAFVEEKTAEKASQTAVAANKDSGGPPAIKPADAKTLGDVKKSSPESKSAAKPVENPPAKAGVKPAEPKPADAKAPAASAKPLDGKKPGAAEHSGAKSATADKNKAREPIKTAKERLDAYIRKTLAAKKFEENVAKVKSELEAYRTDLENAPEGAKPAPPDFAALAKQYNMTAHKTGLVSRLQLKDTDFGKSVVNSTEMGGSAGVLGEIFGPVTLHKAGISYARYSSSDRREFVFWKTDDQPDKVPAWGDPGIKDKVRQEWKLKQARKLALDAANDLKSAADKKENAVKPLKALVAGKKEIDVVKPPKFTWLTSPLSDQPLEISEVGDLTKPGAEFMKKVFGMHAGQVEVATNVANSEIYVVRLIEFTPFRELWDDFIAPETAQDYMGLLMESVRAEVDPAWRAQVLREAKFTKESKKADEGDSAPAPDGPEGQPPPEDL